MCGLFEGAPVGTVVVAENLSIFKEFRLGQTLLKLGAGDEDIVDARGFSWARGAGGVGNGESQLGNGCHEPVDQRGLSGAGGGGDDEDADHRKGLGAGDWGWKRRGGVIRDLAPVRGSFLCRPWRPKPN